MKTELRATPHCRLSEIMYKPTVHFEENPTLNQSQYLKGWDRPIHFHVNSSSYLNYQIKEVELFRLSHLEALAKASLRSD